MNQTPMQTGPTLISNHPQTPGPILSTREYKYARRRHEVCLVRYQKKKLSSCAILILAMNRNK